ncbi:MAG: hypothetical protein ACO2O0_06785 [Desulfurococcales archaeon]
MGFSPEHFYRLTHRHRKRILLPRTVDGGIPARIARTYLRYGGASDREDISYLTGTSKIFSKRVIEIVGDIWRKNLYEVYIDEKVTMDISRLVRISYSINGKSGLLAYPVNIAKIDDFEPRPYLSPFKDMKARIKTRAKIPRINFYGIEFQANNQAYYEVEAPFAIYLALKGVVELIDI